MARPKGPEQRVPVKMRVNIGLMDRLRQLAAENRYSVPKMLTVIMEETLGQTMDPLGGGVGIGGQGG